MANFDINKIVRDNLNRLIAEKDLRAVDIADSMGISSSYISYLRSGHRNISNRMLDGLCKALEVEKEEFYRHDAISAKNRSHEDAIYEAAHHRLILKFIDKKWGLDTNRLLVELEKIDPSYRDTVFHILEGLLRSKTNQKADK